MKHAYLILAHNEFGILKRLVAALDDERNDIFIHFDRKVRELPEVGVSKAGLHILEDRVNVHWGDLSVVEAEYRLFEAAARNDEYAYYHLLSGVDLPLKTQDQIHTFFARNKGKEFIGFSTYNCVEEVKRKVCYWHLFPKDFKNTSRVKRVLRAGFLRLQMALHITRNADETFRKGTQWVSVTDGFVRMMISAKPWVRSTFTHTFCPDEIYKQTLCWNSGFRQRIFDMTDEGHGCMRAISWNGSEMGCFSEADYERLCESDSLFARKFTSR